MTLCGDDESNVVFLDAQRFSRSMVTPQQALSNECSSPPHPCLPLFFYHRGHSFGRKGVCFFLCSLVFLLTCVVPRQVGYDALKRLEWDSVGAGARLSTDALTAVFFRWPSRSWWAIHSIRWTVRPNG
jgi:hypothetical protein